VLAALLLEANAFVPVSRLASAIWDGDGPATAVRQVQDAISGLRRHLGSRSGGVVIERRGQLFRLRLDPEQCDLLTFEEHLRQAERCAGPEDRVAALRYALGCWRGSALAGLPGEVLGSAASCRYTGVHRSRGGDRAAGRTGRRGLEPEPQRLFRLLGVVPGQDFDAYAAANLLQSDPRSAAHLLETLLDHNLLIQHTAGRYRFHDLVRDYARSLSTGKGADSGEDAHAALIHLLDYYDHTARALSDIPQEHIVSDRATGTPAPLTAPQPAGREERMAWLRTERDNIVAAISHATAHGQELRAINLTEALAFLFYVDGPWATGVALFRSAVALAGKRGDVVVEADLLTRLAALLRCQADYTGAVEVFQKASQLYEAAGELRCQAAQLNSLCFAYVDLADYATAIPYGTRALEIFRELKDRGREGVVLRTLGMATAPTDPATGIEYFTEALAIAVTLGRREQQAQLLTLMATAESALGRSRQAIAHLEESLAILTSADRRQWEAMALRDLGQCRLAVGDQAGGGQGVRDRPAGAGHGRGARCLRRAVRACRGARLGCHRRVVVGHQPPERVRTLAALSVPHPLVPYTVRQAEMFWYQLFYQFEGIAEATIQADDWAWLRWFTRNHGDLD